ncbi:MAG: 16S rRNA (guanine(966)-N(2))-methyltransferase RsmD [Deltaproteobacteria bacterium]|nr:16S rRNA (guanine(966)-N(2))-methyltransferase RsmD [Deltaproteobacteria bacterium]
MRVISGSAKGHRLKSPKGSAIRPALDKIKGAIFNILGDLEGMKVLDLFAGTGSIGIEALSRGAKLATFIDNSRPALQLVHHNLEKCRLADRGHIVKLKLPLELGHLPRTYSPFDIVFVDPPYDQKLINPTLRRLVREKILAPSGIVVIEHSPREKIAEDVGLTIIDERKYGQTIISFLKM